MAIGLIKERAATLEGYLQVASVIQEFRRRFEAEMGTINCRELTGLDLTDLTGGEELMNSDIPDTVCVPAVGVAFRVAMDLLNEKSE